MRNFEITTREVLFSLIIICLMLAIGAFVVGKVTEKTIENNQKYYKAVQVDSPELFDYGLRTNVGNTLAYGEVIALEPVSMSELVGAYYRVEKYVERYTRHTRTVTKTRVVNGKSQSYTTTETYYTWDRQNDKTEKYSTQNIEFLGRSFSATILNVPTKQLGNLKDKLVAGTQGRIRGDYLYEDGFSSVGDLRYYWEVVPVKFNATIFVNLMGDTITTAELYYGENIQAVISDKQEEEQYIKIVVWIGWTILTIILVVLFVYFENRWLED